MGWRILVFYPEQCVLSFNMGWRIKFTNIRLPMLKLKPHSGFHELFLNFNTAIYDQVHRRLAAVSSMA